MKYISKLKNAAVKDIDIVNILDHKYRYCVNIGKGVYRPTSSILYNYFTVMTLTFPTSEHNFNQRLFFNIICSCRNAVYEPQNIRVTGIMQKQNNSIL